MDDLSIFYNRIIYVRFLITPYKTYGAIHHSQPAAGVELTDLLLAPGRGRWMLPALFKSPTPWMSGGQRCLTAGNTPFFYSQDWQCFCLTQFTRFCGRQCWVRPVAARQHAACRGTRGKLQRSPAWCSLNRLGKARSTRPPSTNSLACTVHVVWAHRALFPTPASWYVLHTCVGFKVNGTRQRAVVL